MMSIINRRAFLYSAAAFVLISNTNCASNRVLYSQPSSPSMPAPEKPAEESVAPKPAEKKSSLEQKVQEKAKPSAIKDARQKIIVNIPSYSLKLMQGEELVAEYPCRVGKSSTPTPIGQGNILEKRDSVVFHYLSGSKKGQVIRYSHLDPENRTIPMPYDDMRSLNFDIDGRVLGPVIHSTTDYWTVGTAVSHGCIGMKIDDMLALYDKVSSEPLPIMEITYQTLFLDPEKEEVTVWCDIYNKGTNSYEGLKSLLSDYVIDITADHLAIERNLKAIDKRLHANDAIIKSILQSGKDPKDNLATLHETVSLDDLSKDIENREIALASAYHKR